MKCDDAIKQVNKYGFFTNALNQKYNPKYILKIERSMNMIKVTTVSNDESIFKFDGDNEAKKFFDYLNEKLFGGSENGRTETN